MTEPSVPDVAPPPENKTLPLPGPVVDPALFTARPVFDPADCIVIVQAYPDSRMHWAITATLDRKGIPLENVRVINIRDTVSARNLAVRDDVLTSGKRTAVFLDGDMRPGERTERFWQADGDVVGAYYPVGGLHAWENGGVHCGILRVNVEVFRTLPPPWFLLTRTPDGCTVIDCECGYFTKRARASGFSVIQAGWCGHEGKHDGCTEPY